MDWARVPLSVQVRIRGDVSEGDIMVGVCYQPPTQGEGGTNTPLQAMGGSLQITDPDSYEEL